MCLPPTVLSELSPFRSSPLISHIPASPHLGLRESGKLGEQARRVPLSLPMVCDLSPCLSLTEQQRHLLQQQEQQLQQLQQLLASPQLTPVMPLPSWATSPPPALLEGPSQRVWASPGRAAPGWVEVAPKGHVGSEGISVPLGGAPGHWGRDAVVAPDHILARGSGGW